MASKSPHTHAHESAVAQDVINLADHNSSRVL
jgi:hypothetical protein